jgi:uncharacterized LabA/DUF88 family protein
MKIYVDGENFRHGVASALIGQRAISAINELETFPLRKLLAAAFPGQPLEIAYYASKIKLPRGYEPSSEIIAQADQIKEFSRRWVADLAKQRVDYIKAGYLKVKPGSICQKCGHRHEVLQEKGVDVRIAVDIIDDAHRHQEKKIAILSSDTDLIPALERSKKSGLVIIYICFSKSVNKAMSAVADKTITITPRHIIGALEAVSNDTVSHSRH